MPAPLTPIQSQVLDYLRDFHARHDRLPTTRQMQQHFHWSSQTAAMTHLTALAKKGHIQHVSSPPPARNYYRFPRPASAPPEDNPWLDLPNALGWWWKWFQDFDGAYHPNLLYAFKVDEASLKSFRLFGDGRGSTTVIKYRPMHTPTAPQG